MRMTVVDAVNLLRLEYAEMPGLALTAQQAQRLCDLSGDLCDRALGALVQAGFLKQTPGGFYLRRDDDALSTSLKRSY
jgi:hypothetical protein